MKTGKNTGVSPSKIFFIKVLAYKMLFLHPKINQRWIPP
nr:MAG TPA: hypothetical protein [Caudoviricetes sp.]